ncbi:CsgE family curli-type amyloid fiber assembly protein [Pseudomonas sp. NPDC090202]|uniref:CsgE family curli-type amyloid fiber assembly protein n=1 Tax=unclassified Pseudomonas TaxID=196821 RepID=UPI003824F334
MKYTTLRMMTVLSLCCSAVAFAENGVNTTPALSTQRTLNRLEVGGLVVGQTVTQNGRAFYDSFAQAFSEKDEAGRFSVSVTERPTARLGSQVFINYGNRRMLQLNLPPNRSLIPALGADTAAQVFQAILDYQLAQFFGDRDLARDEL